jgi:hypothetical protein
MTMRDIDILLADAEGVSFPPIAFEESLFIPSPSRNLGGGGEWGRERRGWMMVV